MPERALARVHLVLAVGAALIGGGCNADLVDICNRMITCQGDPCAVNQCEEDLKDFSDSELADARRCFENSSCRKVLGGACSGDVANRALRCCTGTPATGCDLPLCQDVPDTEPWPMQCLGETPSQVLCEWATRCKLSSSDPPPSQSECEIAAAAYDDPARAAEASECRSCVLLTNCDQSSECMDVCDLSLIP